MARDPYEVLQLERGATSAEIKRAYRAAARRDHPDLNPGDPQAAERFKEAQRAYEQLADPERRAAVDGRAVGGRAVGGRGALDETFVDHVANAVERAQDWIERGVLPHYMRHYRGEGAELAARLLMDFEAIVAFVPLPPPSTFASWRARRLLKGVEVGMDLRPSWEATVMVRARGVWHILLMPDALLRAGLDDPATLDDAVVRLLFLRYAQVLARGKVRPPEDGRDWPAVVAEARRQDSLAIAKAAGGYALYGGLAALFVSMLVAGYMGW